jgi:pimeloyl-ACP methyl ester carboxylesterase
MLNRVLSCLVGLFLITIFTAANVMAEVTVTEKRFNVVLRPAVPGESAAVTVQLGAVVVTDTEDQDDSTALVLNGTGQTANTFVPMAKALVSDKKSKISKLVLLNYPGHGNSDLPAGFIYADLTLSDYISSLLGTLDELRKTDLKPIILIGHSLGAEVIMLAQQRLRTQGTTLRKKYDVRSAVLLVPDIPGPASALPWAFTDSGAAADLVGSLVRVDDVLGPILDIPAPVWVALFYSDRAGNIIPNATTPAEAVAGGFISLDSPTMGAELIGGFPGGRPQISEGIFGPSSGTVAGVVALEQDPIYQFPSEHRNVYTYATQDQSLKLFFPINGADTVHNIHVVRPDIFLPAIKAIVSEGEN